MMESLNKIKDKIASIGRTFVGTTELWYPTYMVHLDFLKPNDDPMYHIDWAIMHFIKDMPKIDKASVANVVGLDSSLIEYRIKLLCESGDLMFNQNFGHYQITEKGNNNYFGPDGSVMYIYGTKDLLIDGNSLTIMDENIYNVQSRIRGGYKSDIVENVTITKDGRPIRELLSKIEGMTNKNKEKLRIPADSKNFTTTDEPTFGSIKVYFVFSIDKNGCVCKDIFYSDDFVKIPFYSNNIHKFFYGRSVNFNFGFTNYEEKDVKNKIFDFTYETISDILKDLYKWDYIYDSYYIYYPNTASNERPLTVSVSLTSFLKCHEKNKLKEGLKRGEVDYYYRDNTVITISVVSKDQALDNLLSFEEKVNSIYTENGLDSLVEWLFESDIIENRKKLIGLERFDILEKIDNYLFIQSN